MAGSILCIDIGSSSLKGALIDFEGHERAFARETYPREGGSAADWEDALALILGRLFSRERLRPDALCVSGNGPTLVPLTHDGGALGPLHWYNAPPRPRGIRSPSLFLPHAAWFRKERPRDYERTRYLLSSQEWLSHRLGGEAVTVLPTAAYGPYYWDAEQCRAFGLDMAKFPPFVKLGSPLGRVSAAAARRFTLPEGVPIIAGGPDFIMALIGLGVLEPGIVCDRAGTSEGINLCSAAPLETEDLRVLPHAAEGLWNIGVLIPSSGRLFEWFRVLTGQDGRAYEPILEELFPRERLSPREPLFPAVPGSPFRDLPLFFPEIAPAGQKGGPGVFVAPSGLPGRIGFGRAVAEAMGFQVRAALETLERHGFPVTEMRLSGGQGKSPLWNQAKADMSGCTLLVPEITDGELAGDAAAALAALGEAADLREASSRVLHIAGRVIPDPGAAAVYEERFRAYRELQEKIRGFCGKAGDP
jgi:xylulokinase